MDLTLKCCIIDDEPLARELLSGFVKETSFLELVGAFSCASEAVKTVISGNVDLVFLDIQMPELNGFEFAKILPKNCRAIYVTAYEQYAIQGYKNNAIDYLLKPIDYNEFFAAANRAYEWFSLYKRAQYADMEELKGRSHIFVKSEYKLVQIDLSKLLFVEGVKDYVKFHLEDGTTIMSLMNMKTIEQNLSTTRFARIHRSFIVQLAKIQSIDRNWVVIGGKYLTISETYKPIISSYIRRTIVFTDRTGADPLPIDLD